VRDYYPGFTTEKLKKNVVAFEVVFGALKVVEYVQTPSLPFVIWLGGMGGQLGLLTG
jgi:hypothetical protein